MSVRKAIAYDFGIGFFIWLLWFPITSVGPAERPSLQVINPYEDQIKELDGLIEKVRTGHLPDSNKAKFKQLLNENNLK